ncbi:hypothetical protein C8R44DRAFT_538558, partial [Mycena epipterygia]
LWTVSRFVGAEATDGGAAHIPTLERRNPVTKRLIESAETNEEKTAMLCKEFVPAKMATSSVPADTEYPEPAWQWELLSDALLHRAVARMKPHKATYPDSIANCTLRENANLLIPYLGPIYRSLDELEHYPDGWADVLTLVLRKSGKPNYADPSTHRP